MIDLDSMRQEISRLAHDRDAAARVLVRKEAARDEALRQLKTHGAENVEEARRVIAGLDEKIGIYHKQGQDLLALIHEKINV